MWLPIKLRHQIIQFYIFSLGSNSILVLLKLFWGCLMRTMWCKAFPSFTFCIQYSMKWKISCAVCVFHTASSTFLVSLNVIFLILLSVWVHVAPFILRSCLNRAPGIQSIWTVLTYPLWMWVRNRLIHPLSCRITLVETTHLWDGNVFELLEHILVCFKIALNNVFFVLSWFTDSRKNQTCVKQNNYAGQKKKLQGFDLKLLLGIQGSWKDVV